MSWLRARFKSDEQDFRPIYKGKHPEGPWWCSGHTVNKDLEIDTSIIIAFVKSKKSLLKQWPEAKEIEIDKVEKPTFSDRFPKPDWWTE